MRKMKRSTIATALALLALTGCKSISEVVQIPTYEQSAAASFRLPVTPGDPSETVVYVVNKLGTVPMARDKGVIFTTALVIEGATAPLETIPGQYAVAKIKAGKYAISAQRLCHPTYQRDGNAESFPPAGTVMPVKLGGWSTYAASFGQGFMSSDAVFDFQPGRTYVFSIYSHCGYVARTGHFLYPRIHQTDEQGGKYLVMRSAPAKKQ